MNTKSSSERLYLHQDDNDNNDIHVDSMLHQHHIDGIRFLYKQFKKKEPGVIINNPLGYGNSLQVALFLGATRHALDKPILILCEQSEELNWLEHFQKLTQCYNVGVGAPSPFVKKSIFINTMERLETFARRDWSVLVVDNDQFLKEKALQSKFKADFKIWITPVDMKDNLDTFASIYKWIFPKNKLELEVFKAKPGNLPDAVAKAVLLETFLEDIVSRTTLQSPFENPFDKCDDTPRKASKKNKDATGTKVKRSKRSLDVPSMAAADRDLQPGPSAAKAPRTDDTEHNTSNCSSNDRKSDNTSDVETFIRTEPPIRFDPFNEFDNVSRNSPDSRTEFMDDEPMFDTADRLNRLLESNVPMDIVENPEFCFIDSDTNSDSLLPVPKTFDDTSQVSDDSDYVERKRSTPDFLTDNILNEIKEEMSESHNSDMFKDNFRVDDENEESPAKDNKEEDQNESVESDKSQELNKSEDRDVENRTPDMVYEDSDNTKADSDKEDKVPGASTKESDNNTKESPRKIDLDAKLKEMDERAFKKFQGSILDSLF